MTGPLLWLASWRTALTAWAAARRAFRRGHPTVTELRRLHAPHQGAAA